MLDDTRNRLLAALSGWTEEDLVWLAENLERGDIAPEAPCGGPQTCHGSMQFCDRCGDVSEVCDDDNCEQHHCQACGALAKHDDDVTYCPPCREYLAEVNA